MSTEQLINFDCEVWQRLLAGKHTHPPTHEAHGCHGTGVTHLQALTGQMGMGILSTWCSAPVGLPTVWNNSILRVPTIVSSSPGSWHVG